MANRRDLTIGIDGDSHGLEGAFERSEEKARGLDRELAKLERQQAANEKVTTRAAAAVDKFGRAEDKAALAARKLGIEAEKAAEKAEKAEVRAAAAAEAAAKGLLDEEKAARAAARAEEQIERAALKAAEAQLAAAAAAERQAEAEKKVAREAELAAAKERLAVMKSRGQVEAHNATLKALQNRFGDLSREGDVAFTEIERSGSKAFGQIDKVGVGTILKVAAVITALPFAALGAEVAVAGGLGAAIAGLGLAATKSDAQVQSALGKMTSHIKAETKQIAAPFKQTWLAIADDGTRAFDTLAVELGWDFKQLAPVITGFSHEASYAVTLLTPSFAAATDASDKLFTALGGKLPEIVRSLNSAIVTMSNSAGDNAEAFANIAAATAGVLPPLARLLALSVKIGPSISPLYALMSSGTASVSAFHDGLSKLTDGLVKMDHSLHIGGGSFPSFSQKATLAAASAGQLMTAEQAAALGANQLKTAMDALTGKTLTEREALYEARKSADDLAKALKANGAAHGFNSLKGAENEHALTQYAAAAQAAAQKMRDNGRATKDVSAYLDQARQRIIAAAEKMHYSAAAARDLANRLLGIKPPPPIKLSMDDADFMSKLHKAQGLHIDPKTGLLLGNNSDYFNKWLKAKGLKIDPKTGLFRGNNSDYYNKWLQANHLHIDTKTGKITGNTSAFWSAVHAIPQTVGTRKIGVYYVPLNSANEPGKTRHAAGGIIHRAAGGPVRRFADGGPSGPVVGPGSGTSDDIPVWLSNGEYVIRAKQAKKYGGLLEAINQGKNGFAAGGIVGYASGGDVTSMSLADVLQHWTETKSPTTKSDVDKAIKARKTQLNQLKNAEDALYRARHARHRSARDIAAAERRVAAERDDVAAATKKLADVEARYKYGKLSPANQLGSALALSIKDTGAFIKNLQTLADRGYGVLAQHLLAQGDTTAEKTAADAVKMSGSKLGALQKQVQQADQQQTTLAGLGNILTVKTAMKGGSNTWDQLISATGLAPNDLAATLKLMSTDLAKTAAGQALLAMMKAHGFARGGPITGPAGTDQVPLWGTAGEWVVPKGPAAEHRQLLAALTYGRPLPAGTVRGGDGASAGRPIEIHVHARDTASAVATAKAVSHELGWKLKQGGVS
ncbi:hypothetical protein [Actinoallomurus sp. CA-142502]|uniref:hypothetical protein n=1 Tax=Actinoallomurus sp. CA-142502 TaxID=3239885 RepID=UPI003D94A00C